MGPILCVKLEMQDYSTLQRKVIFNSNAASSCQQSTYHVMVRRYALLPGVISDLYRNGRGSTGVGSSTYDEVASGQSGSFTKLSTHHLFCLRKGLSRLITNFVWNSSACPSSSNRSHTVDSCLRLSRSRNDTLRSAMTPSRMSFGFSRTSLASSFANL